MIKEEGLVIVALFSALFAISIWFYIFTLIFIIIAIICEEHDSFEFAIVLLVLYSLAIQFFAKINIFKWIIENPIHLLWIIPGYILFGIIWSWVKWGLLLNKIAKKTEEKWEDFLKDKELPKDTKTISKKLHEEWKSQIRYGYERPVFKESKKKISVWVMYWPISIIWYLLNNLIKDLINRIVVQFRKVYEGIANNAFKEIDNIKIEESSKVKKLNRTNN